VNKTVLSRLGLIIIPVLIAAGFRFLTDSTLHIFNEMLIVLILASMWNLLAGYTGLMSLGHQMFFGIGGYTVFLFSNAMNLHPFLGLPVSIAVASLVAACVAPLLFRLRDAYFAIATWVLSEIVATAVQKTDALGGITGVSLATTDKIDFDTFEADIFLFVTIAAITCIGGTSLILRSRFGLALMSVRDNEAAAEAIGIDVWQNRFIAFILSAGVCGVAGGLSLLTGLTVQPGNAFSADWTAIMTFVVVIGGLGTLIGPIVGTLIYFGLREVFTVLLPLTGTWYLVAMGIVAIVTMLFAPQGLWPLIRRGASISWIKLYGVSPSPKTGMRQKEKHS